MRYIKLERHDGMYEAVLYIYGPKRRFLYFFPIRRKLLSKKIVAIGITRADCLNRINYENLGM